MTETGRAAYVRSFSDADKTENTLLDMVEAEVGGAFGGGAEATPQCRVILLGVNAGVVGVASVGTQGYFTSTLSPQFGKWLKEAKEMIQRVSDSRDAKRSPSPEQPSGSPE